VVVILLIFLELSQICIICINLTLFEKPPILKDCILLAEGFSMQISLYVYVIIVYESA